MTTKIDRRVRRTQELLGDALVALILEKGYETVTIKDITERADVAYVTFFRHYKDIDELLIQHMKRVINELMERMRAAMAQAATIEDCKLIEGTLIFEHAGENGRLYRILLGSAGTGHVRKQIQDMITRIVLEDDELPQDTGFIPRDLLAHHCAASLLGLIEWWLERDMPCSPATMAEIYNRLLISGMEESIPGQIIPAGAQRSGNVVQHGKEVQSTASDYE